MSSDYSIKHQGDRWALEFHHKKVESRNSKGDGYSTQRIRSGNLVRNSQHEGLVKIEYRHIVKVPDMKLSYRKEHHRATITGKLEVGSHITPALAAIALRLTLGSWLYKVPQTGTWTTTIEFED